MGWMNFLGSSKNGKDHAPSREEIIQQALTEKAVAVNGNATAGEVTLVKLKPGKIGGEGTYEIQTSTAFSRKNLQNIGLVEGEDFDKPQGNQYTRTFTVKQKPLEEALAKTYGVSFLTIQRNS